MPSVYENQIALIRLHIYCLADQLIEMDTIRSQRTRFLTHFYNKMCENLGKKERLQLIREITEILHMTEFTCNSVELEELFRREKHLWECNYHPKDLENLHQRQRTLFLDIIFQVGKTKPKSEFEE